MTRFVCAHLIRRLSPGNSAWLVGFGRGGERWLAQLRSRPHRRVSLCCSKHSHELLEMFRLSGHPRGSAGKFLCGCRVSLSYLIDLVHGAVHLCYARRLFSGCGGNFLNQLGGFVDRGDQLAEHAASLLGDRNA